MARNGLVMQNSERHMLQVFLKTRMWLSPWHACAWIYNLELWFFFSENMYLWVLTCKLVCREYTLNLAHTIFAWFARDLSQWLLKNRKYFYLVANTLELRIITLFIKQKQCFELVLLNSCHVPHNLGTVSHLIFT